MGCLCLPGHLTASLCLSADPCRVNSIEKEEKEEKGQAKQSCAPLGLVLSLVLWRNPLFVFSNMLCLLSSVKAEEEERSFSSSSSYFLS